MVRVLNCESVRFLNLIIHYVNGEIFGTVVRGPYSGMVPFVGRSDTGSPLYISIHLYIYRSNSNVDNLGFTLIILCSYIYTIKTILL